MKIVICPLVSRDMPKATRAVNSARSLLPTEYNFSVVPVINSKNNEFIEQFIEWCQKEHVEYKLTPSNGTPSKGKNECLKFFRESDYDGLSMLDGDDMYYPSAGQQIERHLKHHPGTDALIVKPSDQMVNYESGVHILGNVFAVCWGTHHVSMGYKYGPGEHELFSDRNAASNLGGHVFYSKKLAQFVSYDEEQILGEDLLLEFEMLKLHQEGKISFWLSFASDVQFLDRTTQSNIQSEKNETDGDYYFQRLVSKICSIMDSKRSSFGELPVEFPPLLMSHDQKIEWIKNFAIV